MSKQTNGVYVRRFEDLCSEDVAIVGGKNASLGEMIQNMKETGIRVPKGFAITSDAYWAFVSANNLDQRIKRLLKQWKQDSKPLNKVGVSIRKLFLEGDFPYDVVADVAEAHLRLCKHCNSNGVSVAVRSSATAEDLPEASFAGQQESYLNVSGEDEIIDACRKCYASLFTDRAIAYREEQGFDHLNIALSIGVQKMVRSDKASAGVMFTLDPETGFRDIIVINGSWGLGESVVQGAVNPDEYTVFKPLLTDQQFVPIIGRKLGNKERKTVYAKNGHKSTRTINTSKWERDTLCLSEQDVLDLSRWAAAIETHYKMPMDIEWAKDGETDELFIVQARPETVQSQKQESLQKTYRLVERSNQLLAGLSIGDAIATGRACVIENPKHIERFQDGSILVTTKTDPDWVPIMKRAAGIVTDLGGRTSHAAIVSRELGIPAVIGTGDATNVLHTGQEITISCAEGNEGFVYEGLLEFEEMDVDLDNVPDTRTQIMLNIASPAAAFRCWRLPCEGIGLARMEFIINNMINIHPMALVRFPDLEDAKAIRTIDKLTRGYEDRTDYFVDRLSEGIARIAAPHYPNPVIVRMSDFKTNEYAALIGGKQFEPQEDNPMLGFRGAARYYSKEYREGFALECRTIKRVREDIGFSNVVVMIPFCRTLEEAEKVLEVLEQNGLKRGENGLEVYVMCEIPSNVVLAEEFANYFDGFSIGSNDLTQLVLGVDRDSSKLSHMFDERNEAVKRVIAELLGKARKKGIKVGICGQAPSDFPEFAAFLVENGIDSISLNPDSIIPVKYLVADEESRLYRR